MDQENSTPNPGPEPIPAERQAIADSVDQPGMAPIQDPPPEQTVADATQGQVAVSEPTQEDAGVTAPQEQEGKVVENWRTILPILLLIFLYPIGLALMWLVARWSRRVKIIISVVAVLITILIIIDLL